ncbi:alpha/beta hydrolase, partial [Candidatus Saccharibacteria bacterium]|nr:alpha/beta hydrolase [Candidatus Saccharibacteria bacterium]
ALLTRYFFQQNAEKQSKALEKYVPADVSSIRNLQYKNGDNDAYLDVYYPSSVKNTNKKLPTVVWIHGGGWISGNKENVANYLKILASKGYTTVGVNYTIAPEAHYPTPVIQTTEALKYLNKNAEQLHIDKNQFVLAGDSAGSQIAAQVATIITNPSYEKLVNIPSPLEASQLAGMLLNCGAYDIGIVSADGNSEGAKLLRTFLWSYSGKKDFMKDGVFKQASIINYVTPAFPPSFITAGNNDPLLPQSKAFAKKLISLGVPTTILFYPQNYSPPLPHEYQFNLDTSAGQKALNEMVIFLEKNTKQN